MKKALSALLFMLHCSACGGAESADAAEGAVDPAGQDVRGARYCEVLLAYQEGTDLRIDVYNTFGLNDCPAEAWDSLDPAQIQEEHEASRVILNGPRRWIIDGFVNSELLDPTPVSFGGIEMRKAGELSLPLSEASSMPYVTRSITRNTTYVFDAGKSVYELMDPADQTFVMQSFSLEQADLSEGDLAGLGEQLDLPAGWTFRARELSEEMRVTAVNGVATVVQDELENTYQLSQ